MAAYAMPRLIDKKQYCFKLSIRSSKFDDLVREGLIPDPEYLPGCTKKLWRENVVDEWIESNLSKQKPILEKKEAAL